MRKIKVAWICHFVNEEIQKKLPLVKTSSIMAPWITSLIEEIKYYKEIDLHVISPLRWLKKDFILKTDGVTYYFIKTGMPFIHRHWPSFFRIDLWTNFALNRRKIKKYIHQINPDIINLHGIENAYYSVAIMDLCKYPILITIQGLHSLGKYSRKTHIMNYQKKNEQKILKHFKYYGIRVKFLETYIKEINQSAEFYWFKYPFNVQLKQVGDFNGYKYDCIFFARIAKDKGIEDLIDAISIVKKHNPIITLNIIGQCDEQYKIYLQGKIESLGLLKNIIFSGFIEEHSVVHDAVIRSKMTVLPTYNDILPGTIIESMMIGTPVIAYAANGVVDFNTSKYSAINLVPVGDIQKLACAIIEFADHKEIRDEFIAKGKRWIRENFNNCEETKKMINAYKEIIKNAENS